MNLDHSDSGDSSDSEDGRCHLSPDHMAGYRSKGLP